MGYLHIDNLYKNQDVLLFREVYALEKIHGTSAHVSWKDGAVHFFSGGEKHERFVSIFDTAKLTERFTVAGQEMIVFGEAYGGSQQGQCWRYGEQLRFVAFDVKIGDLWLSVPQAEAVVADLGLEFVAYTKVPATIEALDAERDAPSTQAKRNGIAEPVWREGIVIRPPIEVRKNNGERVIAKHKRADERETRSDRVVCDPSKLKVLEDAQAIADEWVTPTRLSHVLDKLPGATGIEATGDVVRAMVEDVMREGAREIIDSPDARKAIGRATALLFKARMRQIPSVP